MALTNLEAKNLLGSTLNGWLLALSQGSNVEDFLRLNTNAQRLINLLTTEPAPVLVRQEFNEDNVEVNINTNGLAETFMDSLSSFFDGPEFTRFLDTLRNQITLNYINPEELDLPEWRNTPTPDDPHTVSVDDDFEDELFDTLDELFNTSEDVESPTRETVTEQTTQPIQTPVQVFELSDDDEDEVDFDEVDDSTFEPHPDIDRNTRSRWTSVGPRDQMSGYVFAAYSHLPYHFTRGGHQYKLTLSGSDFVATRV